MLPTCHHQLTQVLMKKARFSVVFVNLWWVFSKKVIYADSVSETLLNPRSSVVFL